MTDKPLSYKKLLLAAIEALTEGEADALLDALIAMNIIKDLEMDS